MSLITLPKELLLSVTDNLPLLSLEALALTLNRSITPLCVSQLKPLFARRRHKALLVARFGSFRGQLLRYAVAYLHDDEWLSVGELEQRRALFDVPATARISFSLDTMFALDYLDLKGDLHWLGQVDKGTEMQQDGHKHSHALTLSDMNALLQTASKVNVKFPPSFVKLATSIELMDRIPGGGSIFSLDGGLRRVPAAVDKGAGGYIVRFYCDQQGCGYWSLYIEPGDEGRHCILGTLNDPCFYPIPPEGYSPYMVPRNWDEQIEEGWESFSATDEERQEAKRDGVLMARMHVDDVSFEGLGFEQWLALAYFEPWLISALRDEAENGEELELLKEYVRQNYIQ